MMASVECPVASFGAPQLQLSKFEPNLPSKAAAPRAFLQKIEHVEISSVRERGGVSYFVVDIYLRHHRSHIPTKQREEEQACSSKHSKGPDYQLEKRFTDFAELRHDVWMHTQQRHTSRCTYCDDFMNFIVYSWSQPRLLVKLTSTDHRVKIFSKFLRHFLVLAKGAKCPSAARYASCSGAEKVPSIVADFLRKP